MSKVKIVQIALAAGSDGMGGADSYAEYLDDQGRVWYQTGRWVTKDGDADRTWVTEWHQLDLPVEQEGSV